MPDCCKVPTDLVRLWMHESRRVYMDKLIDGEDHETFNKVLKQSVQKAFEVSSGIFAIRKD